MEIETEIEMEMEIDIEMDIEMETDVEIKIAAETQSEVAIEVKIKIATEITTRATTNKQKTTNNKDLSLPSDFVLTITDTKPLLTNPQPQIQIRGCHRTKTFLSLSIDRIISDRKINEATGNVSLDYCQILKSQKISWYP